MLFKIASLGFAFFSLASTAWAQEFNIKSGDYARASYYDSTQTKNNIKVFRRGNSFRVVDGRDGITYALELGKKEEQLLNPKLLEQKRKRPESRILGNLIEKITISDARITEQNKIEADFHLYLKSTSVFGAVEAKILLGGEATSEKCQIVAYGVGNQGFTEYEDICVHYSVGTKATIESLNTGLSPELNRTIGFAVDLLIKFFSPLFSGVDTIYKTL